MTYVCKTCKKENKAVEQIGKYCENCIPETRPW